MTVDYDMINALINKKGLTIARLAKATGMSWEGFKRSLVNQTLTVETLEKLSNELGVHPTYFWGVDNTSVIELEERIKVMEDRLKTREQQLKDKEEIILLLKQKLRQS